MAALPLPRHLDSRTIAATPEGVAAALRDELARLDAIEARINRRPRLLRGLFVRELRARRARVLASLGAIGATATIDPPEAPKQTEGAWTAPPALVGHDQPSDPTG